MSHKNNTCLFCNKANFIPEEAFINVENYGNNSFKIRCVHCGKPSQAFLNRVRTALTTRYAGPALGTNEARDRLRFIDHFL